MKRDEWNERYRASSRLWSATPNQFVAAELAALPPGRALDVACGEGRNALWLASRGWRVTAVDFADVAVERGRAADPSGLVDWVVADLESYVPEPGAFDLVVIAYLQLTADRMAPILRRAVAAVAPGGVFFLVGHDRRNLAEGYGGPQSEAVLYGPQEIVALLEPLTVDRAETVDRAVDTPTGARVALDCLVRAHRDPEPS